MPFQADEDEIDLRQLLKTLSEGRLIIIGCILGALLLAVADFLAQRAFAPTQLPVGVVTVSIGGLYFVWLLMREARRQ